MSARWPVNRSTWPQHGTQAVQDKFDAMNRIATVQETAKRIKKTWRAFAGNQ